MSISSRTPYEEKWLIFHMQATCKRLQIEADAAAFFRSLDVILSRFRKRIDMVPRTRLDTSSGAFGIIFLDQVKIEDMHAAPAIP